MKRCTLAEIRSNGAGFGTFCFDPTDDDALTLLDSPDAELCRGYHKTWREIRRRLDSAQAAAQWTARTTATPVAKE